MITIWKYNVLMAVQFKLELPEKSRVLSVQMQDEAPCMWVRVDTERPLEVRQFAIVGTGNAVPDGYTEHLGTWQQGRFVFHLFEPIPKHLCIHDWELSAIGEITMYANSVEYTCKRCGKVRVSQ